MVRLAASWHVYEGRRDDTPVDLWLIDDLGVHVHVRTGADWCLVVDHSVPYESYDMAAWGRIDVQTDSDETAFARHRGDTVLAVREQGDPVTGRMALELDFASGGVRCESWGGDLRVTVVDRPERPDGSAPTGRG